MAKFRLRAAYNVHQRAKQMFDWNRAVRLYELESEAENGDPLEIENLTLSDESCVKLRNIIKQQRKAINRNFLMIFN